MRALRLTAIVALIAFSFGQFSLAAKGTPRTIMYSYTHSGIFIMSVWETAAGAQGHVTLLASSMAHPALETYFKISAGEFEKLWSTLNAPSVEKYRLTKQHDLADYYVFLSGNEKYAVKKTNSALAVSVLSSQLRAHADAAMKSGMTPIPVTKQN